MDSSLIITLLPFILMFGILYFLMIRPQLQEQKKIQSMLENLKKDDRVLTRGGLAGKIIEFQGKNDHFILLDLETGSKAKILKSHVTSLIEK